MYAVGGILIFLGICAFFVGLNWDITISTAMGSVVNLGELQKQLIFVQVGLAGFISGSIFIAAGALVERLKSLTEKGVSKQPVESLHEEHLAQQVDKPFANVSDAAKALEKAGYSIKTKLFAFEDGDRYIVTSPSGESSGVRDNSHFIDFAARELEKTKP